jgi:hypothetical protein
MKNRIVLNVIIVSGSSEPKRSLKVNRDDTLFLWESFMIEATLCDLGLVTDKDRDEFVHILFYRYYKKDR